VLQPVLEKSNVTVPGSAAMANGAVNQMQQAFRKLWRLMPIAPVPILIKQQGLTTRLISPLKNRIAMDRSAVMNKFTNEIDPVNRIATGRILAGILNHTN
jgi:hypothetical protein